MIKDIALAVGFGGTLIFILKHVAMFVFCVMAVIAGWYARSPRAAPPQVWYSLWASMLLALLERLPIVQRILGL